MAIVGTLLDKARAKRGIPTDMALGERIGKSRQVISQWRAGSTWPEEDMVVKLAELAGDEPAQWLVAIKAVRSDGAAAKVWAALAKRLGAAVAVLVVAALPYTATAKPLDVAAFSDESSVHYAKLRMDCCLDWWMSTWPEAGLPSARLTGQGPIANARRYAVHLSPPWKRGRGQVDGSAIPAAVIRDRA